MAIFERVELGLILLAGISVAIFSDYLPTTLIFARVLLYASALLLLQSLIRDVLLLLLHTSTKDQSSTEASCICMESVLGMAGVVIGLLLLGISEYPALMLTAWHWVILVLVVLILGFLCKDLVLELRPLRIRRDKNHLNIVFQLKN